MDILNVILHGSFEIIGDSQCGRHQESVFKIFQGPWIFSLRQAVLEVVFRKPVSVRAQERCRQVWRCRCTWNSQSPRLPTSAAIDARRLWMMVVLVYSWLQIRLPIYAGSALKIASQKAKTMTCPFTSQLAWWPRSKCWIFEWVGLPDMLQIHQQICLQSWIGLGRRWRPFVGYG